MFKLALVSVQLRHSCNQTGLIKLHLVCSYLLFFSFVLLYIALCLTAYHLDPFYTLRNQQNPSFLFFNTSFFLWEKNFCQFQHILFDLLRSTNDIFSNVLEQFHVKKKKKSIQDQFSDTSGKYHVTSTSGLMGHCCYSIVQQKSFLTHAHYTDMKESVPHKCQRESFNLHSAQGEGLFASNLM